MSSPRIRDAYGIIPSSTLPVEDTMPEPPQMEERSATVTKPTASEKLMLGYHGPALGDGDHVVLTVLNEVLFGGRASRLYRKLVIEGEMASELRGMGLHLPRSGPLRDVRHRARRHLGRPDPRRARSGDRDRPARAVVSEAELSRAKARLELSALQGMDTTSGKAEQIGFYATVLGDPNASFRRLEAYRRVTTGDLRRVARAYLVPRARTRIVVKPETASAEAAE